MSQSNSKSNPQEDTLPQLVFMVLGGVVLLTFLPVMVFSMVFAYLSYASFYEKEERKWIRSGIILGSGFFITFAGWGYLREIIPTLIEGGSFAKKIAGILSRAFRSGWFFTNFEGFLSHALVFDAVLPKNRQNQYNGLCRPLVAASI